MELKIHFRGHLVYTPLLEAKVHSCPPKKQCALLSGFVQEEVYSFRAWGWGGVRAKKKVTKSMFFLKHKQSYF